MTTSNIIYVEKTMTGYGNWNLTAHYLDGHSKIVHTTNARLIDNWKDEDGEVDQDNYKEVCKLFND